MNDTNHTNEINSLEVYTMNKTVSMAMAERNDYYHMNKRRIWMIGLVALVAIVIFSLYFFSKTVTAERTTDRIKSVASIEVKHGDTLWSIASEFVTEEYDNLNEYIEEIKRSNGMVSDTIRTGNFIIVPYYTDAS
jgi:hypothetical protein